MNMTAVEILSLLAEKGVKLSVVDGQLKVSAPKGVLTAELRQLLVSNKLEILELLSTTGKSSAQEPIPVADRNSSLPLSFGQQRLWFLNEFEPGSSLYNIPSALRLQGKLHQDSLQQALDQLVARHESLRTTFADNGDQPIQIVADTLHIPVEQVDVNNIGDTELNSRLTGLCLQPFSLQQGPLLRLHCLRISENDHALLLVIHHIVADGWSMGLLLSELAELYNSNIQGRVAQLKPLAIQLADYSTWQRNEAGSAQLDEDLQFWSQALAGAPLVLDLPADRPRPASPGYEGAWLHHKISASTREQLEKIARDNNATLYMVLLTAFDVLLGRYSGTDDLLIGSPIAGRSRTELEGMIGALINTIVLRADLSGNPTFSELLHRNRSTTLDAFEHQALPFEKLVEELQPDRNLSHSPIYQVLFNLQNRSQEIVSFDGLKSSALITETGTAKLDLHLLVEETDSGLSAWFEYATELFDANTIERMARHFDVILQAVIASPQQAIDAIALLDADERSLILNDWNNTATDYPEDATLVSLFEQQVDTTPDLIAVEYGSQRLSYRQLDERANQLAHELINSGVRCDDVIGVYMERSLEMVVALYGIQKAGAAYTPLDPEYPAQRLANMLEDSGTTTIVCQTDHAPEGFGGNVIELDNAGLSGSRHPTTRPKISLTAHNLAYVIFTSGSTGRPKGVMNEHYGIVNRLLWMQNEYGLTAKDRVLQKTAFSFDVSVWEFFWPLISGARLVMAKPGGHKDPAYLADIIENRSITTMHFVPSMLQAFVLGTETGRCKNLKRVMCSGEALPLELTQAFYNKFAAELHNLYGPTEAAVDVTYWPVPRNNPTQRVPIGTPVANTQIYITDKAGQLAPVGVPGELLIAGRQVARGYINRDELTAERFISDSFNDDPAARAYRTGDLARYLANGDIEYLGRIDAQVKLRGFRIELGEIDAALANIDDVRFSTTLVRATASGNERLVSYVGTVIATADEDIAAVTQKLRDALQTELPEYMVPTSIVFIDELPLTPNGKLDRNALPEPSFEAAIFIEPETATEIALATMFADLLDIPQVGNGDDFFALGGHSLLATRLITRIRDQLNSALELKQLFQTPTVKHLAAAIDSSATKTPVDVIAAVPRDAELPLSFAQQRLWFLHKLMPDSSLYNVPWAMRLEGELNIAALQYALSTLLARHESLHTRFIEIAGEPMQYLAKDAALPLDVIDLRLASAAEVQSKLSSLSQKTFNLDAAPLLRVHLIRDRDDSQIMLFVIHHIIADAWSLGVLFDELMQVYSAECEGLTAELAPLPIQYADYAAWQHEHLAGEEVQNQLSYWRDTLNTAPAILELPTDHPRPAIQSYRGKLATRKLPGELLKALHHISGEQGATLFMTLLAGFNVMLSRYASQDDIVVGTPVAGRPRRELEGLIGFFLNTLPIRTRFEQQISFRELLEQVKQNTLSAYMHQDLPFEQLVEELQPKRDMSLSPIFQVMFTLQTVTAEKPVHGDLQASAVQVGYDTAKYDITWSALEKDGELSITCEYASDLFDHSTIQRMLEHYQVLLQDLVKRPSLPVQQLGMLSIGEQNQLRAWNNTAAAYPKSQGMHQLFEQQAAANPTAIAVEFETQQLSYAELNERANGLAQQLIALGAGPDTPVAICVERSLDTLVGLLGILKSGSGYVPLDPIYPPERIAYMLEDSGSRILVSEPALAAQLPMDGIHTINVTDVGSNSSNPAIEFKPEQLAYLIYTSGSTGLPKGVQIEHQAAVNFLHTMADKPGIQAADRLLAVTTLCFDISILEMFLPLLNGATVVIASQEQTADGFALKNILDHRNITMMQATPATWRMLHDANWNGSAQLTVLVGGEALGRDLASRLHQGNSEVWNMYGPTETTIWSACHRFMPHDAVVSVGKPIANTLFYVLDDTLQPVPLGIPGALWIGGDGVARGYWQRDELNDESFIDNPFDTGRIYNTGDRVRWLTDGSIEVLGRTDFQVKLRGFRIELGEIETRIGKLPGVTQSVVILREDAPGDQRLVAYNIAPEGITLDITELRDGLKGGLPDYMLPSAYVQLDRFPLTPNGKIDRKALPAPDSDSIATTEYVAPRNATEATLVDIWTTVLNVEQVGINDDFFALGGHSLLAMSLMSRIRDALGIETSLLEFFVNPTVATQAAHLKVPADSPQTSIPVINRDQRLPLTSAQIRLWFLDQLGPGSPVYNMPWAMRMDGEINVDALQQAVDAVVARHESLRTSFPAHGDDPYQLIHDQVNVPLRQIDMSGASETEVSDKLTELGREPMSLQAAPLVHLALIRLGPQSHVLSIVVHHIIFDAWSHGILLEELAEHYTSICNAAVAALPPMRIQFADYAHWQQAWLDSDDYRKQLKYWTAQLDNAPALLELPTDRPRPAVQTSNGANAYRPLPKELQQQLHALAKSKGCTLFMVLMTAFNVLLSKYSNQKDIVVGSSIAGRRQTELEKIIGFFLHNLAIRTDLSDNPSYSELLKQVTNTALEAFAHQEIPFENLVEELAPERDTSYPPIVQVHFVLQHFDNDWGDFNGLKLTPLGYEFGTAKFDMIMFMFDTPDGLAIRIEYNTDLFNASTMDLMTERFETLLSNIAASPEIPIEELSLISAAEQQRLATLLSSTGKNYTQDLSIHQQFEACVERSPDKLALSCDDASLSYAELNAAANRVAHKLIAAGAKPDQLIGLSVERSLDTVIGILGILKSGAGYLPLDPYYPKDRLAYMLEDSGAELVLVQAETAATLPTDLAQLIDFADIDTDLPEHNPNVQSTTANIAYVIYTSGSTGKPKGVLIEHRNVTRLMAATEEWFSFNEDDVWTLFHSYAFDFTVWELWGALTYGGHLVVVPHWVSRSPEDFYELLQNHKVTVLNQTPSAFAELQRVDAQRQEQLTLRYVIFGGEALDIPSLRPWFEHHGDEQPMLINMYGITETTVHVTYRPIRMADCDNPGSNIGIAIPDLNVYVLDANMRPLPTGIPGEMYIGGAGLARGYLNRPELTAERFLPNPLSEHSDQRLYKTGDVARYLNNGDLEYLGRADDQIKLRGFRIELGEIETALTAHPTVEQSVVLLREDSEDDKRLVAYVVADSNKLDPEQVTEWQQDQVEQWQGIFQETYGQAGEDVDASFNITGWNSSYTEAPIQSSQMLLWVESTVERIQSLKPKRVLEIGSGTGLLMSRLAPSCERYVCTDFSAEAIAAGERLRSSIDALNHVEMFQRGGDELDGFAAQSFDVIVINSVAQYFPDLDYLLKVIDNALPLVREGGALFLGDLRSFALLRAHHTSIQLFQADKDDTLKQLNTRIDQDIAQDEELLCDPGLLLALQKSQPRISSVRFDLKRGDFNNELTRFRFDGTLFVGKTASNAEPQTRHWSANDSNESLQELLRTIPDEGLLIRNIPDARLAEELRTMDILEAPTEDIITVAALREQLQGVTGVDPEALYRYAESHALDLQTVGVAPGYMHALFRKAGDSIAADGGLLAEARRSDLHSYANNPLHGRLQRSLVPLLKKHLGESLPDYMVPGAFVTLASFPLTPSGKVARNALPPPERLRSTGAEYVAPRTPIEETLAGIWQDILGLERIGIHDDFFALGGHSLLATKVVSRIREGLSVNLALLSLFNHPTIAGLAEELNSGTEDRSAANEAISTRKRGFDPELSFAQQRLWFLDQLDPGNPVYNQPWPMRLKGNVNLPAMQQALDGLLVRHEALRTVFTSTQGKPAQHILPELQIPIEQLPTPANETELNAMLDALALHRFDLSTGPLMIARLIPLGDQDQILMLVLHHVISDGWSADIVLRDLSELYNAGCQRRDAELPEMAIQYADYALWQRDWLQGDELERQLAYWRTQLKGSLPLLDLPTDRPRPPIQTFVGGSEKVMLDPELLKALKDLSTEHGWTLYMTLLGAFQVLLARYSGQDDICVGTPIAGRQHTGLENMVGVFINTLVMRADLSEQPSFVELMAQVKQSALQSYNHQDLPFEKLVEELQPERNQSYTPIFQVLFTLQNRPMSTRLFDHLDMEPVDFEFGDIKFDLTLNMADWESGLRAQIDYNSDMFDRETITTMLERFGNLLRGIVANPKQSVSRLPLLTTAERNHLVDSWVGKALDFSQPGCIHETFERQVQRVPDSIAVRCGNEQLTYTELNCKANQLAHRLIQEGAEPDQLVGLSTERSIDTVIGILGILKSGAGYLPLDPHYPADRLEFMIKDSNTHLIVAQRNAEFKLEVEHDAKLVYFEDIDTSLPDVNPQTAVKRNNLAYVIYTSGSTGKPKGVLIEHQTVTRLMVATDEWFGFNDSDVWTLFHSYAFDFTVWELWGSIGYGGKLIVVPYWVSRSPEDFYQLLEQEQVTVLCQTPSAFTELQRIDQEQRGELTLRYVIFGGEALDPQMLRPWFGRHGDQTPQLVNMYGITETTVHVTYRPLSLADCNEPGSVIGCAIPDLSIYLLDGNGLPVPDGIAGEMYVGGAGLARGYLDRPELTAERFIASPFKAGERLYRTGDLGRYRNDGELEYMGRVDDQVKLRGFRIELGEIESALTRHDSVSQSVVLLHGTTAMEKMLIAYVAEADAGAVDIAQLKQHVGEILPDYMVPTVIMAMSTLPLTSNGKVDRRALPNPVIERGVSKEYVAPQTPTETLLCKVFATVLDVEQVGVNDDFFELGGHSLLAAQVVARIRDALNTELQLRSIFDSANVASLALVLDENDAGSTELPISIVDRSNPLPLSFSQQRLWFLDQLETGNPVYNLPWAMRLHGMLNVDALQFALDQLTARHEVLRTHFGAENGVARQVIEDKISVVIDSIDCSGFSQEQLTEKVSELGLRCFELSAAPLFRVHLLNVADDDHVLAINMHHIISDGWSLNILFRELVSLYESSAQKLPVSLPDLPLQYADYAGWQRDWLDTDDYKQQLSYWSKQLKHAPGMLELPTDYPRGAVQTFEGAHLMERISPELTAKLRELAAVHGCTLFMVLLAAFNVLLSRYSNQTDVLVGTPVAGRKRTELETLVGFFINTLVIRSELDSDPDFIELLQQVKQTALDAFDHQELPFEKLVDEVQPTRDMSHSPLFQVMFVLQNQPWSDERFADLQAENLEINYGTAKFDLTLSMQEADEGLISYFEYNTALFKRETVAQMLGHFEVLLAGIVDKPHVPVSALPLITSDELQQQMVQWNPAKTHYADNATIQQLFENRVTAQPHSAAVSLGDTRLSYAELNARANQLAHHLISQGAGTGTLIGICLERSTDIVVSILAVFKSGAAYVPIDPDYPDDRIAYMLEDSGADIILSHRNIPATLPAHDAQIISIDADEAAIASQEAHNPAGRCQHNDLAYIIYTSGSTGNPKGVMLQHQGACNLVAAQSQVFGLTATDRMLQFASISFDASIFEILMALGVGAELILGETDDLLPGAPLLQHLQQHDVTAVTLPPSALMQLPESALPQLRVITVAGEACPQELVDRWANGRRFFNLYGPTEATVWATYEECRPGRTPTIGKAVPNAEVYVLSEQQQPVPVGVAGELCLGGAGLARGYLNRPELSAEKFIAHPFAADSGKRIYRTGDLVRFNEHGDLEFLGRIDHQVKVRGFRIELGEIENSLVSHPAVRECVVLARGEALNDNQLLAYLVAENKQPTLAELRNWLQQSLPDYMIPASFVILDEWPLTPNGKIDRKALPDPDDTKLGVETKYIAPRNRNEEILAEIWSGLLGTERVGIHDNFFELGGDSILSIQIIARATQRGLHLTPKQLFNNQTIAELAVVISADAPVINAEQGRVLGDLPLTPIQHWFLNQNLPEPQHFNQSMLLESDSELDHVILEQALHLLTDQHDALRLRFTAINNTWQQSLAPFEDAQLLVKLANATPEQLEHLQGSLNITKGPLLKAALISDTKLLIIVHHLAIDWVSWPVLLGDLEFAYTQLINTRPVALPRKTTSFKAWSEQLGEWAASEAINTELDYWQQLPWDDAGMLPLDHSDGDNSEANTQLHTLELSAEKTSGIMQGLANRYRVSPRDILLSAVATAISESTDNNTVIIDLEGHGREDLFDGTDLSRSVGWFTTLYPVVLQLPADKSATNTLPAVRDQIAALPNKGIGFGVLRYLAPDTILSAPTAEVSFNYLGVIDQVASDNSMFSVLNEPRGPEHSLANARPHKLDINCMVSDGRLYMNFGFSKKIFAESTIAALAGRVEAALDSLISIGDSGASLRSSPAAFPLADLNQNELDKLLQENESVEDIYPLTPLQQGMLFHSLLDTSTDVYFASFNWLLEGRIDIDKFQEAWNLVINQHSSLRSATHWQGLRTPMQVVQQSVVMPFTFDDWSGIGSAEQDAKLAEWVATDQRTRFDLSTAPLTRISLIKLSDNSYKMIWAFHHMIMDGWSVPLVIREVFTAYESLAEEQIPKLVNTRPFSDYIEWLQSQDKHAAQNFWSDSLRGFSAPTPLPGANAIDASQNQRAEYQEALFELPATAGKALKAFAQKNRLTVNTITQAAWALLLSRYSGEDDVVFGATTAGRPAQLEGIESMIGLFLNTLPIRIGVDETTLIVPWLQQVQDQQLSIQQYEYSALVDIQGWSDVPRGANLFETLLAFENYPDIETMGKTSGSIKVLDSRGYDRTNFPLTLNVAMMDTLYLRFVYDRNLFNKETLERLGEHLLTLLTNIPEAANKTIAEVTMLGAEELQQVLVEWNDTRFDYPADGTMHGLFEQQVKIQPDSVAIYHDGREISYGDLNARANQLAHRLIELGIGNESLVAVCTERTIEMITGMLAILKAGGAYVPADPDYPADRVSHMLEDSQAPLVLTNSAVRLRLPATDAQVICLDEFDFENSGLSTENPGLVIAPERLGYTIYTSGSTGLPKGVEIEHRNAVALIEWMRDTFKPEQMRGVLASTSVCFDLSIYEIFGTLGLGGRIVLVPNALALPGLPADANVTLINTVPSAIAELVRSNGLPPTLKTVNLAGEPLSTLLVNDIYATGNVVDVNDLYGPSEDTTYSTWTRRVANEPATIGRPLHNTQAYVLDQHKRPVPIGSAGELYLAGAGVTRGYRNQAELTAEKYIANPFSDQPNARMYGTGDLVRYRQDGNLEYIGRLDHQVKLRGFRIELGEIETQLDQIDDVHQSVVLLREDVPGLPQLVAYVASSENFDEAMATAILSSTLPDYMLPTAYVALSAIPVTANGKIDRSALPAPELGQSKEDYVAPETEAEQQLAVLWGELLGVEKVGIKDDFFALGGHSLIAMQLISRIAEVTDTQLPLDSVFNAPTLAELALLLDTQGTSAVGGNKIVRIDRSSRRKRR